MKRHYYHLAAVFTSLHVLRIRLEQQERQECGHLNTEHAKNQAGKTVIYADRCAG